MLLTQQQNIYMGWSEVLVGWHGSQVSYAESDNPFKHKLYSFRSAIEVQSFLFDGVGCLLMQILMSHLLGSSGSRRYPFLLFLKCPLCPNSTLNQSDVCNIWP